MEISNRTHYHMELTAPEIALLFLALDSTLECGQWIMPDGQEANLTPEEMDRADDLFERVCDLISAEPLQVA